MTRSSLRLFSISFLCLLFNFQQGYSQLATFDELYDLVQVKCTGCHGGDSPQGAMDLSGTKTEVYNTLVGVTPVNPSAASKGYERVKPGYPDRSFIMHKLATTDWDDNFGLEVADGDPMPPNNLPALEKKEIELFRQWILYGAPMEGTVVDPQILEDYYDNGLALETTAPMDPPAAGEGFQLHLGPIFLAPLEEREFYKKHEFIDNSSFEITSMDLAFNNESHHFILYKMGPALGSTYPEGLRNVEDTEESMIQNTLIGAWQNASPYTLPAGTAYKVSENTQVDLNYHLKNYSTTLVLAANVYVNVYTQAISDETIEMHSQLFPISLFDQFFGAPLGSGLIIPNDGNEHTFTEHLWIPDFPTLPFPSGTYHIWRLSTHTHARGIDYDMYLSEDANGTKGEKIFEGFYNSNYTFDQGFYDWEHPPVRIFDPLLPVDMGNGAGIVHEATYINDEDETLYWGNSVDDEMMLIFMHFSLEAPTPTSTEIIGSNTSLQLTVSPNPASENIQVKYEVNAAAPIDLKIYNLQGKTMFAKDLGHQMVGNHQVQLNVETLNIPAGIYLLELTNKTTKEKVTEKVVVTR